MVVFAEPRKKKQKATKTLTRNLGNLDEVPDSHGEPNGPQNRIPGISRVPRMYLDFQSSSNPIGAKLLESVLEMDSGSRILTWVTATTSVMKKSSTMKGMTI